MKLIPKTSIVILSLFLLGACQKAVRDPQPSTFTMKGNVDSVLYPLEVVQQNEDVLIQLKPEAPQPQLSSRDSNGKESDYNFRSAGQTLIVPDKFDQLCLRYHGIGTVEIIRKNAVIHSACDVSR